LSKDAENSFIGLSSCPTAPGLRYASGNLQGCAYTALAIATGKFRKRPASRKRARLQVPYREKVSFAFPPDGTPDFCLLEIRSIFWATLVGAHLPPSSEYFAVQF
jgi:hypothetical protein